jgi:hypothetical protein
MVNNLHYFHDIHEECGILCVTDVVHGFHFLTNLQTQRHASFSGPRAH